MKWWIGGGILLVCIVAMFNLQMGDNMVYFYTPKEILENKVKSTFKVGGLVKRVLRENGPLIFLLSDNNGIDIMVNYWGLPPDMFKEQQGVVVEGRWDDPSKKRKIVAKNLMVKHSEEYKKPDDHGSMNQALLEKSILK